MNEKPLDYFRAKIVAAALVAIDIAAVFAIIAIDRPSSALRLAGFAFAASIPLLSAFTLACETRSERQRSEIGLLLPALGVVGLLGAGLGIASSFFFLSVCTGIVFLCFFALSFVLYLCT